MADLEREVDGVAAERGFSGVVRADRGGIVQFAKAYGLAHRGYGIPNTLNTRFGTASGSKGLTALAVIGLIDLGLLELGTTARSVLGADLPLIDDAVTVEHLLAHRSGIGDYLDENSDLDVNDYLMPVPVQHLATTEQFLAVLDGYPMQFTPGEQFAYCNGGYVVLALIAERVSGEPYHDLVARTVCAPAGMTDTAFLRSDEPAERTAMGYVPMDGTWRTNVFHLPVRGTGDGGAYTTVADFSAFWPALMAGRIVPRGWVDEMIRPRSLVPEESMRYGLGFWLHESNDAVMLVGYDSGVSFKSLHQPSTGLTYTVVSNTAGGIWPVASRLDALLLS
ncbi:serine hydrolase domain-containing protein [Phytoactinopolyspora limicola]|uniref:serine hydrolase domain-containing protein n=1 Tax=Phytoactinopolyspora limicola TaxID=2715536 RepID=UPI00140E5ED7|nr:serine hydrolase domain-containing protein [Phytoactinopolyspora limicola]